MRRILVGAACGPLVWSCAASAQLINFEPDGGGLLPDGTAAVDDLAITNQFEAAFGVRFGLDTNLDGIIDPGSAAFLEQGGSDGVDGFLNDTTGIHDQARPGFESRLGDWHLRTTGLGGGPQDMVLMIEYTSGTVDAASGEIWDIDGNSFLGTEQYLVKAFNDSGVEIGSIVSPEGTTTNDALNPFQAAPWLWSFDFRGTGETIAGIRVEFVGTKTFLIGLAFDNFDVSNVPSPGSAALIGLGGVVLLVPRRRRR